MFTRDDVYDCLRDALAEGKNVYKGWDDFKQRWNWDKKDGELENDLSELEGFKRVCDDWIKTNLPDQYEPGRLFDDYQHRVFEWLKEADPLESREEGLKRKGPYDIHRAKMWRNIHKDAGSFKPVMAPFCPERGCLKPADELELISYNYKVAEVFKAEEDVYRKFDMDTYR